MKKIICLILCAIFMFSLSACSGSKKGEQETTTASDSGALDVDLTKLSSTMVYSEVSNMVTKPDDYRGKKVRMNGTFAVYSDDTTGKKYFACLIADATACCSQGLEFVLKGEHTYPTDYPAIDSEITVEGTFDTYMEGDTEYYQLVDANFV